MFKAGIPIGIIKKTELNKVNEVDFFSDFSQIYFVKIASYKKEIN